MSLLGLDPRFLSSFRLYTMATTSVRQGVLAVDPQAVEKYLEFEKPEEERRFVKAIENL